MSEHLNCEYLVIGAGIIGLSVARELSLDYPNARVIIIEKESGIARHASGRNSGVLHAGFYYAPDSLKARFTRDGNNMLRTFLTNANVAVRECGKVVVASDESQLSALDQLAARAEANDVDIDVISAHELAQVEPRARTIHRALWSPTTAVANPVDVARTVANDATQRGVDIRFNEAVTHISKNVVTTSRSTINAGHIINCAGMFADRIATMSGIEHPYVVLPFKGLYWKANVPHGFLTRHVYPVPDSRNPFLGVHATVTVDGGLKIGPTAIPALSRENYSSLNGIRFGDIREVAVQLPRFLTSSHHNGRELISSEIPKYIKRRLVEQAALLVPDLKPEMFNHQLKPGIRAQLFNTIDKRLEMDFVIKSNEHGTHILNAVSPAWTSSFAVAKFVVDSLN